MRNIGAIIIQSNGDVTYLSEDAITYLVPFGTCLFRTRYNKIGGATISFRSNGQFFTLLDRTEYLEWRRKFLKNRKFNKDVRKLL